MYEKQEILGKGGNASVYAYKEKTTKIVWAIKIMYPENE